VLAVGGALIDGGVVPAPVADVVSSYSMERTWNMGIVRVTLSSPASWISLLELETTVPLMLVPSRISTVACWPPPVLLLHEESETNAKHIAKTRRLFIETFSSYKHSGRSISNSVAMTS
jgi:hypothetical protein